MIAALTASLVVAAGPADRASAADIARAPQGQAALTCQPWQTPVTVPAGTVLTPRVFPTAEHTAAPRP